MKLLEWISANSDIAFGILFFGVGSIVVIIEAIGRATRRRR